MQNKMYLIKAEEWFKKTKEEAQESWTGELLDKFDNTKKEMWDVYKNDLTPPPPQLKSMLPLIQGDSEPVFDPVDKCKLLKGAFFNLPPTPVRSI